MRSKSMWISGTCLGIITAGSALAYPAFAQTAVASAAPPASTEVVITSTKQGETTILHTPIAVEAVTGATLQQEGAMDVQDILHKVPGFTVSDQGPGNKRYVVRGISDIGEGTVGLYLDDIDITGANVQTGGGLQPDIKLFDLERVEVLEGPQGTTFGSSSMVGTLRYITAKPNVNTMSGYAKVGVVSQDYSGMGDEAEFALNAPVVDGKAALRFSGHYDYAPGYISTPTQTDANNEQSEAFRVEGQYDVTDRLTLNATAMYQKTTQNGLNFFEMTNFAGQPLGPRQQAQREQTSFDDEMRLFNVTVNYHFNAGDLTATASVNDRYTELARPASQVLASAAKLPASAANNTLGILSTLVNPNKRRVENFELRYASHMDGPIQFLAGAIYETENTYFKSAIPTVNENGVIDPAAGVLYGPTLQDRRLATDITQIAGFGDVTVSLPYNLKLTGGLRVFQFQNSSQSDVNLGVLGVKGSGYDPVVHENEASAIGRVNLAWQMTPDQMFYGTISQGYRPGGTNDPGAAAIVGVTIPGGYTSDSLINYEAGYKAAFLDHRLNITSDVYLIDWSDIQLQLKTPLSPQHSTTYSYFGNAGSAKVYGAEFVVDARPLPGWTVDGSVGYTDAQITETVSTGGNAGDTVPYAAKWTFEVDSDYRHPITDDIMGFIGADANYTGARPTDFPKNTLSYLMLKPYWVLDARVGVEYKQWTGSLIVKNLLNDQSIIDNFVESPPITLNGYFADRPRQIWLEIARKF